MWLFFDQVLLYDVDYWIKKRNGAKWLSFLVSKYNALPKNSKSGTQSRLAS